MHELIPHQLYTHTGDITMIAADAIVNAANSTLLGGLGVDGAIHSRGGPAILAACRKLRRTSYPDGLPTGEAVATTAGNLPARYVIHTVGPIWQGGTANEAELLERAYANSLAVAEALACSSLTFPAISTGAYGFPKHLAAETAIRAITNYMQIGKAVLKIGLVFFHHEDRELFEQHFYSRGT